MDKMEIPKLTQTVQKGGCAAKVAAEELRRILRTVKFPPKRSSIQVDGSLFDDAAIDLINNDMALVQTLDFFTPIVDSPYIFGQIAASNSLSDVYAMGGRPRTCMAILAFPLEQLHELVITEIMQGACDQISKAGASLVGGHSIDDDTIKFGLSVTGEVNPKYIWKNSGAQPGDVLILTKPLGTGTATAALKRQNVTENEISEEIKSMIQLNFVPEILTEIERSFIHAATDITGFGLIGHAMQMAIASDVTFRISQMPYFTNTLEYLRKGNLTKAHRTNAEYVRNKTQILINSEIEKKVLFDPQTSGGLLLSVQKEKTDQIMNKIKSFFPKASRIGQVECKEDFAIIVQEG